MSNSIRQSPKQGGKRTIFLVNTGRQDIKTIFILNWIILLSILQVQLVHQQSDYIRTHTDFIVGVYYGDLGVDFWDKDKWENEIEKHQVLVLTAQVFLNIIDHNIFCKMNQSLAVLED